jgi:hypothetical protein
MASSAQKVLAATSTGRPPAPPCRSGWAARGCRPDCADILTIDADRRGLTPLFREHILPCGEVKLNMTNRLSHGGG